MDPSSPPLLTNDEANFTVVIVVAAGHHGPNGVVHHGHDVNVKVLRWWRGERSGQRGQNRPQGLCCRGGAKVLSILSQGTVCPCPPTSGGAQPLTPLFLMDLRSIDTTSFPSTLLHLNPFVHVTRMLCGETGRRNAWRTDPRSHVSRGLPREGWTDTRHRKTRAGRTHSTAGESLPGISLRAALSAMISTSLRR